VIGLRGLVAGSDLHTVSAGAGIPVVLLHGLTATHRYVVMGSRALERTGHRVLAYDARGHGASAPAPDPAAYGYDDLAGDLLAVMDRAGVERAVLAGASMGAHTALRVALDQPRRVSGLVLITPAFDPAAPQDAAALGHWDALSDGLRNGGVEGFVAAYGEPQVPPQWRETLLTVLRQRLSAHEHPAAVADALRVVPRSRPFAALEDLGRIAVPTAVVADRDEPDPGHPLLVGEAYAERIPGAELVVEEPGASPIAWQGGRLSRVIARVAAQAER
jgi:pimeloyl-ACP methyl ester carboxylesterase